METSWEIETATPVNQRRDLPMKSAVERRALRQAPYGAGFRRRRGYTGASLYTFALASRLGVKNVATDRLRDEFKCASKLAEVHRFPLVHVLDTDREGRHRLCARVRRPGPNPHHVGVILVI